MPGLGTSKKFELSTGWRYVQAHNSYFNSRINHTITNNWVPYERISVMDLSARYNINTRWSVTASLPIVFNSFSNLFPQTGRGSGIRYFQHARDIGDLSLFTASNLFKTKQHPFENISLGIGIKIPTGAWNLKNNHPLLSGTGYGRRAMFPPAIQPGDGGVGILVGASGFKTLARPSVLRGTTFFASGLYLINPRNHNGTDSIVAQTGLPLTQLNPIFYNRLKNSVTDSYTAQVGISVPLPNTYDKPALKGFRFLVTGHAEGVPAHDLIGKNNGFRQPGYSLSVGPGVAWAMGRHTVLVDCPIVFNRHIDPYATLLPLAGQKINPQRQFGLVAPMTLNVRYICAI